MEKIIFADNMEMEIQGGASLSEITVMADNFVALQTVADALTKEGNLKKVKFTTDGNVTGEYTDMKLEAPLFRSVDITDGKVAAVFAIREKTDMEKEIEALKEGQTVQDGAIMELAGMMGGEE